MDHLLFLHSDNIITSLEQNTSQLLTNDFAHSQKLEKQVIDLDEPMMS